MRETESIEELEIRVNDEMEWSKAREMELERNECV